jgi:hypothetical protein
MQSLVETVPKSTALLTQSSELSSLHPIPRKLSWDRTNHHFQESKPERKAGNCSSSCFFASPAIGRTQKFVYGTHSIDGFWTPPSACARVCFQRGAIRTCRSRAPSLCNIPINALASRSPAVLLRHGTQTQGDIQSKLWALYVSHSLSAWGDKMWEFSVPFILLGLNRPDAMSFVGVYAICTGVANILFGPIIGYLVDKYPRLQTVIVTLVLQNVLISISFLLLYAVLSLSSSSGAVGCALISGVVTFCAAASLASTARFN